MSLIKFKKKCIFFIRASLEFWSKQTSFKRKIIKKKKRSPKCRINKKKETYINFHTIFDSPFNFRDSNA